MSKASSKSLFGYSGKIAVVDLETQKVTITETVKYDLEDYLGGRGLAVKILWDMLPPNIDAFDPCNIVVFATGPFTGTLVPGSGRWTVACKSPLTGLLTTGSGGGQFGLGMKRAGFDAVVVTGKAKEPSFLLICNGNINIYSALDLWSKTTWQTEDLLRKRLRDSSISIASIGPAAENLVPITTIIVDKARAAGRGGAGAVMASKNLKAIVVKGETKVPVAYNDTVYNLSRRMLEDVANEDSLKRYSEYSAISSLRRRYEVFGGIPAYNNQRGIFQGLEKIGHEEFMKKYQIRAKTCASCNVACSHIYAVKKDENLFFGEGPSSGTVLGFGCRCGVTDLNAILRAQTLCDQYSLDVISTEATIGFVLECYEKGLIKDSDIGGKPLVWGDGEQNLELIQLITKRQGIGEIISQGVRKISQILGNNSDQFAPHVKGMEMTAVDPRAVKSWGLAYAVSSRGACHMRAYSMADYAELDGFPKDKLIEIAGTEKVLESRGTVGKGKAVAWFENIRTLADCLSLCKFVGRGKLGFPEYLADIVSAVTGRDFSPFNLFEVGERIINLERLINLREGLTVQDDTLPYRWLNEPLPDGPAQGETCNLEPMLKEYYEARNWDLNDGKPSDKKLEELRLTNLLRR
jgi:aldehyde:ferredoxin oxidoreductase